MLIKITLFCTHALLGYIFQLSLVPYDFITNRSLVVAVNIK